MKGCLVPGVKILCGTPTPGPGGVRRHTESSVAIMVRSPYVRRLSVNGPFFSLHVGLTHSSRAVNGLVAFLGVA